MVPSSVPQLGEDTIENTTDEPGHKRGRRCTEWRAENHDNQAKDNDEVRIANGKSRHEAFKNLSCGC